MGDHMETFIETLKNLWEDLYSNAGLTVLYFLVFLIIGLIVIRLVKTIVKKETIRNRKLDNSASSFITSVVSIVLYVLLAIILLNTLGFSTAGLIAAFSAVAVAIALGLQDTLSSLTNGILIIFTKPFKQGDFIDVNGTSGTVKEIRLFNTVLNTPDNLIVILPNSAILNSTLKNYSTMPIRRVDIVVPVPYSVELQPVKDILMQCVKENAMVINLPEPFVRLTNYGASSLDFTVRVWTKNSDYWTVKFDLMECIFNKLRENGTEIPFNQLDVHVIDQGDLKIKMDREAE